MKTQVMVALAVVLAASASVAYADIRYTTHVSVKTVPGAPAENVAIVAGMMKTLVPARSTRTYLTSDAARIEPVDGNGPVTVLRGADLIVLDPVAGTYSRLGSFAASLADYLQTATAPSFRRTGEQAVVAGLRAERVVFSQTIQLPVPPLAGIPATLAVEGELWVTDAFREYGAVASRAMASSLPFLTSFPAGLVVRQLLRQPTIGYEVELTVADLVEEDLQPALFEIPDGYREVAGAAVLPLARRP